MATVLKLESNGAVYAYDLMSSSNLRAVEGTIQHVPGMDGRITTTMQLVRQVEPAENIRIDVNDLQAVLERAILWNSDTLRPEHIWFYWSTEDELVKRSVVLAYALRPVSSFVRDINLANGTGLYELAITHEDAYEEDDLYTQTSVGLSTLGGVMPMNSLVNFTANGRIAKLVFEASDTVEKIWLGIRPVRTGALANPKIEVEAGTPLTDTTEVNDAGASGSGNNCAKTTFATNDTLIYRTYSNPVTPANFDLYVGRYTVLLRAKTDVEDTTIGVQLAISYKNPTLKHAQIEYLPVQYFTSETAARVAWRYIELGSVTIPPSGLRHELRDALSSVPIWFGLLAERVEGTGSLYADCYVLIPEEHQVILQQGVLSTSEEAYVFTNEDGTVEGYIGQAGSQKTTGKFAPNPRHWSFPWEGGDLVIAAAQDDEHDLSLTANVSIYVYRKWRLYREDLS